MRIIAAFAVLVVLSGCGAFFPTTGAEGLSVVTTKKTIADHVISLTSGKNCSHVRQRRGLTYCEEDEKTITPRVYCYKTLARVTCYDRPDPHRGRYIELGKDEHNKVK